MSIKNTLLALKQKSVQQYVDRIARKIDPEDLQALLKGGYPLSRALRSSSEYVRLYGVIQLARQQHPLPWLTQRVIDLLQDPNNEVQWWAVNTLDEWAVAESLNPLFDKSRDENAGRWVRNFARRTAKRIVEKSKENVVQGYILEDEKKQRLTSTGFWGNYDIPKAGKGYVHSVYQIERIKWLVRTSRWYGEPPWWKIPAIWDPEKGTQIIGLAEPFFSQDLKIRISTERLGGEAVTIGIEFPGGLGWMNSGDIVGELKGVSIGEALLGVSNYRFDDFQNEANVALIKKALRQGCVRVLNTIPNQPGIDSGIFFLPDEYSDDVVGDISKYCWYQLQLVWQ